MVIHTCLLLRPASQAPPRVLPMPVRGTHKLPAAPRQLLCTVAIERSPSSSTTRTRRSANFQPNVWDYESLRSFRTRSQGGANDKQLKKLKEKVRHLILNKDNELVAHLQLLDDVRRLGLGYQFDEEIKDVLGCILQAKKKHISVLLEEDLYARALMFRLLREHGFHVSQDVFDNFKDETGNLKHKFSFDPEAMLSLYEASHLAVDGEAKLDAMREFTTTKLSGLMPQLDPQLKQKVAYALELPLHWRTIRVEARRYIDDYKRATHMNPTLLLLAMHDFNLVQSVHQAELKTMISWWTGSGLRDRLSFARDRLTESFMFAAGIVCEPKLGFAREEITKAAKLITIIDDIYDVYGSTHELELFTSAVNSWSLKAIEELPDYMKFCYSTLHNTVNGLAKKIHQQAKWDALPFIRKVWVDLLNAFLVEAKWSQSGVAPTLEEYLSNARISVSGHVLVFLAFLLSEGQRLRPTKESLECFESYHPLILSSCAIFRLCNDLATSSAEIARGDVATSIQCYMKENGVSEAQARIGIQQLILNNWKTINKESVNCSPLPRSFAKVAMNIGRISHCTYQHGDGHGAPDDRKKRQIESLFFEPIHL